MLALLYCRTQEVPKFAQFVGEQEAAGHRILFRNSARFDGELELFFGEKEIDRVYFSEAAMRCLGAHQGRVDTEVLAEAPCPISDLPNLDQPTDTSLPPGYRMEERGVWWRAIAPEGRELKAERQRAEAEQHAWNDNMEMTRGSND